MYKYFKGLICSCLLILISSCSTQIKSIKVDQTQILEDNVGYLLLTIDTNLSYSKFEITGPYDVVLQKPDFYEGKNYYLLPLNAGNYRIYRFFTGDKSYFEFDEDDDEGMWNFVVKPQQISYVGDFRVRDTRRGYSKFTLVNNSSFALEYLEKKFPNILSNRSISYEGPGEDFFFDLVREHK